MNEGAPSLSGNGQVMVFVACQTLRDDYGIRRGKGSCDLFGQLMMKRQGRGRLGRIWGLRTQRVGKVNQP